MGIALIHMICNYSGLNLFWAAIRKFYVIREIRDVFEKCASKSCTGNKKECFGPSEEFYWLG